MYHCFNINLWVQLAKRVTLIQFVTKDLATVMVAKVGVLCVQNTQ